MSKTIVLAVDVAPHQGRLRSCRQSDPDHRRRVRPALPRHRRPQPHRRTAPAVRQRGAPAAASL